MPPNANQGRNILFNYVRKRHSSSRSKLKNSHSSIIIKFGYNYVLINHIKSLSGKSTLRWSVGFNNDFFFGFPHYRLGDKSSNHHHRYSNMCQVLLANPVHYTSDNGLEHGPSILSLLVIYSIKVHVYLWNISHFLFLTSYWHSLILHTLIYTPTWV